MGIKETSVSECHARSSPVVIPPDFESYPGKKCMRTAKPLAALGQKGGMVRCPDREWMHGLSSLRNDTVIFSGRAPAIN